MIVGLALALAASVLAAAAPTPKPQPKPTPATTNACAACKERRPTLPPEKFAKEPDVAQGYAIALKYPATLDAIHCFCECAESPMYRHKTLLTCFTDLHAAGCGVCLSEARLAAQLKERGLSDAEIKTTVESVHRTDGHPAT
ncbi:MAG TPA: PCYCGC motif-containing (lipo)protein [Thermoanaerobaculia bacterium]